MSNKKEIDESLKPQNMLNLYAVGAFPMADGKRGEINWYCPETRCVIIPGNHNIPRSLKSLIKKSTYEIKIDFNPLNIIQNCADRDSTWISSELINAYKKLIDAKFLHSVEVYQNERCIGGLYGIAIRGAFFGESMFSLVPQASKIALAFLLDRLTKRKFSLLDVQYMTDHLRMFGAKEIPFSEYELLLSTAYQENIFFI